MTRDTDLKRRKVYGCTEERNEECSKGIYGRGVVLTRRTVLNFNVGGTQRRDKKKVIVSSVTMWLVSRVSKTRGFLLNVWYSERDVIQERYLWPLFPSTPTLTVLPPLLCSSFLFFCLPSPLLPSRLSLFLYPFPPPLFLHFFSFSPSSTTPSFFQRP